MSQFEGGNKVRCADCSRLAGNRCGAKNTKVSVKKRRKCDTYVFKGQYENRQPSEATYVPYTDKKIRKMIKRLIKLGIMPVREDGSLASRPCGGCSCYSTGRTRPLG
jgi:hypothetical protein